MSRLGMKAAVFAVAAGCFGQDLVDPAAVPAVCPPGASTAQCQAASSGVGAISGLPRTRQRAPQATGTTVIKQGRQGESEQQEVERTQAMQPEPPSEFQQFIAASTGKLLPIFGAELFERAPSTFSPVDRIPVTANYIVGPGDEVVVRVWGQVNLNLELTVDRSGAIFLPQVGNVVVAGQPFSELQAYLRGQLERSYRNFDLSVTMGQLRSIQVFVVGHARRPGVYTISSLSTLVNALFACGGPSAQGSLRRIQVKRDQTVVTEFDAYALLLSGERNKDARLISGDVINIPAAGDRVAIDGSVGRGAIYELRGGETVADLLAMAGGFTPVANRRSVKVERVASGTREALEVGLQEGTALRNGDLVMVAAIAPAFDSVVTLRGNVANPGRFTWRPGIRLRDIIPDKEAVVTKLYWERRNALGQPVAKKVPPIEGANEAGESQPVQVAAVAPAIDWSYAVIERRSSRDLSQQLIPFHLGRLVIEGDARENHELEKGDIVTIFSQSVLRVPVSQQSRQVRLEGEVHSPGIYEVAEGETLGDLIERAGGLSQQAYLYGAHFIRESTRIEQQERIDQYARDLQRELHNTMPKGRLPVAEENSDQGAGLDSLRRVVEQIKATKATGRIALGFEDGKASMEMLKKITLENGDRFIVPSRQATVHVLGAVYNSGALLHQNELRVRDYMKSAGGCSRSADCSRTFIIRADGTVVSRQNFGRFGASFEMSRLHPGDSIVVPQAMPRASVLRNIRDWTQISTQMALGAGLVSTLR